MESLGKLVSQVGEYLNVLEEKEEMDRQHQCLEKILQQLDQLQQQTLYSLINNCQEH
ncbi:hypothetical protein ACQKGD_21195 [Peribacillus frigoritolerans]|uniref:hypothetical protein n=1 Tax=Peribacillus frigoritolerans TaxID=450367 RepID=UPI000AE03A60|nr:hypothetical protein [Peribacillus frigoritolerans]USK67049.1 hypothetical protein LIT26_10740 [Peribacillus frigoritolerans]